MRAGVPALRSGRLRRARLLRPRDRGAGRRGVPLQSEQPDGAPLSTPARSMPRLAAASRRARCSSWTSASSDLRPTPAKGAWPHAPRVRAMWPCSPRSPSSTEWRGCGWDIRSAETPNSSRGFAGRGRRGPSPRSPRPRASPPWKTSNTSRARAMYWRASERGFPASLSSLGLSVVPSDANFLLVRTPAKDIPERLYNQGVLVRTCDSFSVLSCFWCRVAVRTRKENARLAMAFSRALRAEGASGEGEPDERAALLAAALWRARMAEARRRRSIPVGRAKPITHPGHHVERGEEPACGGAVPRAFAGRPARGSPSRARTWRSTAVSRPTGSRWGAPGSCRPRRAASRPTCA